MKRRWARLERTTALAAITMVFLLVIPACNGTVAGAADANLGSRTAHLQIPASAAQPEEIAVPLYVDPGSEWDVIENDSASVGFVIMNPDSGPGSSSNPSYATAVRAMQAAGIKVLGYDHTGYADGSVSISQAEAWATDYYSWYGVNGIFFDEAADVCNATTVHYYSTLYNFTKNQSGDDIVALNPGTATGACFGPISDIIVTFEDTYKNYTTAYSGENWTSAYPDSHFWNIIYDAPSASDVAKVLTLAHQRGAGWVYITDETLPNPYAGLPSYWGEECNLTTPIRVTASANVTEGPAPLSVNFTSAASGGLAPYGWNWTFGDHSLIVSAQNTTHTYAAPGVYRAWVNLTNSVDGENESNILTIDVTSGTKTNSLSTVTITPSSAKVAVYGSQSFTATPICSSGSCPLGVSYSWNLNNSFGTLNSTTGGGVSFTAHGNIGSSGLRVNASLNGTTVESVPANITIVQNASTLSAVSITPPSESVDEGGNATFTAAATCSTGSCPAGVSYSWSLNNTLGTLNSQSGSHTTFVAGGNSGLTLLVLEGTLNGEVKRAFANITITPGPKGPTPLEAYASMNGNVTGTCSPFSATVQFYGNATGGFSPYSYEWSFDDGTSGSPLQDPVHTFTGYGPYNVSLTVTDAHGNKASAFTKPISFSPPSCSQSLLNSDLVLVATVVGVVTAIAVVLLLIRRKKGMSGEQPQHEEYSPAEDPLDQGPEALAPSFEEEQPP